MCVCVCVDIYMYPCFQQYLHKAGIRLKRTKAGGSPSFLRYQPSASQMFKRNIAAVQTHQHSTFCVHLGVRY